VRRARACLWILALAAAPAAAAGQDLAARITDGGDGVVRMSFAVRDGVEICERGMRMFEHRMNWSEGRWRDDRCAAGPAVVEMRVRGSRVDRVRVLRLDEEEAVGARDLGTVEAAAAARALLQVAREGEEDAVFPIMLADVDDAWRGVLELAQDRGVSRDVRKSSLFWVGQEAAHAATEGLADVARDEDEDQGVRDAAIFALSQRDPDESVPVLMDVARTAEQAKTRRTAFFWLAQMDDPRVVAFLREVLVGRGGR